MFPCGAGPPRIYKPCLPVKRDGDLNRFLQNKPSAAGQPLLRSGGEKEEKTKARTETKEIKASLLPGSISNLLFCPAQLTLQEEKGRCRPWSAAPCLASPVTWGCPVLPSAAPRLGPSEGSAVENWAWKEKFSLSKAQRHIAGVEGAEVCHSKLNTCRAGAFT